MPQNTITPIKAFHDNYIWCLQNGKYALVVDPGDPNPVINYIIKQKLELVAILITHHHPDHVGGNKSLIEKFNVPVYGPSTEIIPGISHKLVEGDRVFINELGLDFTILDIPGHTLGHIAYHHDKILFCGDTLFSCGCGRLFEGTPQQMYTSLMKIAQLPDDTVIYCTHEYTEANIKFALHVDPLNKELIRYKNKVKFLRKKGLPSLPVTLAKEKQTNPFLRSHKPNLAQAVSKHRGVKSNRPSDIFAALREWKDSF